MKKVMIVDGEEEALKSYSRVLNCYSDIFSLVTVINAELAIQTMDQLNIDLVVADMTTSETNNANFLSYLRTNYPKVPLVVMVSPGELFVDNKIKALNISSSFDKPVDISALSEKILSELDVSIHGEVHGIGLSYFLQMLEREEKTCSLTVTTDSQKGSMVILNGELISAESGELQNEEAVYEILTWDKPSIVFENIVKKMERTIQKPLGELIKAGLRKKKELKEKKPKTKDRVKQKKFKKTSAKDSRIEFHVGNSMHIKIDEVAFTYKASLVGIKEDDFLILTLPHNFEKMAKKYRGKDINVKFIYEGIICAFKTKLMDYTIKPAELLFLKFPELVGYHSIRLQNRIRCFVPARTIVNNLIKLGVIIDINKNGCGFLIQALSESERMPLTVGDNVPLMCKFPGIQGEVHIMGELKNIRDTSEGMVLGLEFHETISIKIQEIIAQFVVSIGDLQMQP